ncbi:MAG: SDR family oxidoreductase, partial [Pirellulales bacterium]
MANDSDAHPVAVVTGAGADRIGLSVIKRLVQRGYDVAIHAHRSIERAESTAKEINASGRQALAVQADLTDEKAVHRMAEIIGQRFGRIDALVNCAAIWERKRIEDVRADDVRRHFDVNVLGTFLCCQIFGLRW